MLNFVDKMNSFFFLTNSPDDIDKMVDDLAVQLRKLALSDETRMDALFLKYNKDRLCFMDIEALKDICKKLQLPGDENVLNRVRRIILNLPFLKNKISPWFFGQCW